MIWFPLLSNKLVELTAFPVLFPVYPITFPIKDHPLLLTASSSSFQLQSTLFLSSKQILRLSALVSLLKLFSLHCSVAHSLSPLAPPVNISCILQSPIPLPPLLGSLPSVIFIQHSHNPLPTDTHGSLICVCLFLSLKDKFSDR